jgi:hypothetical protein
LLGLFNGDLFAVDLVDGLGSGDDVLGDSLGVTLGDPGTTSAAVVVSVLVVSSSASDKSRGESVGDEVLHRDNCNLTMVLAMRLQCLKTISVSSGRSWLFVVADIDIEAIVAPEASHSRPESQGGRRAREKQS